MQGRRLWVEWVPEGGTIGLDDANTGHGRWSLYVRELLGVISLPPQSAAAAKKILDRRPYAGLRFALITR
jgi:hypothetical protein